MPTTILPRSRTPLHHWHAAHGAHFAEVDGWQVPAVYTTVEQEIAAARTGVAVADVSAFAKLAFQGAGVNDVVRALAPGSPAAKPRGVALLAGSEPVLACRLTEQQLLLLDSTPDVTTLADRTAATFELVARNELTAAYAGFCLIGPRLEDVLRRLTSFDVSSTSFPIGSCAETGLAGVHAILVSAQEFVLPSARVQVAWDLAEYVWDSLFRAAKQFGILPVGLDALHALRRANSAG